MLPRRTRPASDSCCQWHGQATLVEVTVQADNDLALLVRDNGTGIKDTSRRSGLANLARRAEHHGGTLTVSPAQTAELNCSGGCHSALPRRDRDTDALLSPRSGGLRSPGSGRRMTISPARSSRAQDRQVNWMGIWPGCL